MCNFSTMNKLLMTLKCKVKLKYLKCCLNYVSESQERTYSNLKSKIDVLAEVELEYTVYFNVCGIVIMVLSKCETLRPERASVI